MACPYSVHACLHWLGDYLASRGRNPDMVNEWTRDDLPDFGAMGSVMARWKVSYGAVSDVLDAVVAHLNANGGVPQSADSTFGIPREDYEYVDWPATCAAANERADRGEADRDRWRRAHSIVEQERDQAREQWKKWEYKANEWRERAEAAEADAEKWMIRAENAEWGWERPAERFVPAVDRDKLAKSIDYAINAKGHIPVVEYTTDVVMKYLKSCEPKFEGARWSNASLEAEVRRRTEALRQNLHGVEVARDEWKARAEAAEKRHTWPKTTPSGHTYVEPNTYAGLRHRHGDAAQAEVECWEADECPPEPTWEMVGIAHREVERIQRDYCECQEELVEASLERDQWMARAEAAEARTAVTREDVERIVHRYIDGGFDELHVSRVKSTTDAFMALLSGDDPAVHVVRESDVAAVQVEFDSHNEPFADGERVYVNSAADARNLAGGYMQKVVRRLAVARAIEAGQDTCSVEQKAKELYGAANAGTPWGAVVQSANEGNRVDREVVREYRAIAAHVLGQETDHA